MFGSENIGTPAQILSKHLYARERLLWPERSSIEIRMDAIKALLTGLSSTAFFCIPGGIDPAHAPQFEGAIIASAFFIVLALGLLAWKKVHLSGLVYGLTNERAIIVRERPLWLRSYLPSAFKPYIRRGDMGVDNVVFDRRSFHGLFRKPFYGKFHAIRQADVPEKQLLSGFGIYDTLDGCLAKNAHSSPGKKSVDQRLSDNATVSGRTLRQIEQTGYDSERRLRLTYVIESGND